MDILLHLCRLAIGKITVRVPRVDYWTCHETFDFRALATTYVLTASRNSQYHLEGVSRICPGSAPGRASDGPLMGAGSAPNCRSRFPVV
jgi:hypothetical protein